MGIVTVKDGVERNDWVEGNGQNPAGIQITLVNTDGGGGKQTSTVSVSNAGTSGYTTDELTALIRRVDVYGTNGVHKSGAFKELAQSYAGGTAAVIAIVTFEQDLGYVIPAYAAGF